MALRFFNTLGREKQEFTPVHSGKVSMYTCGPTVYNYAHIGNFRAYVFEDLLRRFLKFKGFAVTQVMNLTDVDDKTIRDSQAAGMSLLDFTEKYTQAFFEDMETLNIEKAEVYPKATDHVQEMVQIIEKLVELGIAYKGDDGSIYYSIQKFAEYGKLNKIDVSELKVGARVAQDEYDKDNAADFALWKAWDEKDGDVFWETPFGKGRPGWHIECSAMSMKHLSSCFEGGVFTPEKFETFDIHTGGVDNAFPHHEDEIAQTEGACAGTLMSHTWLHCEHLQVDGKKMSKSLGNFYTLRDILEKGYDPLAIRYLLLATNYRQQLNFTFEGLEASGNAVKRFHEFMVRLKSLPEGDAYDAVTQRCALVLQEFEECLDDDLNISGALGKVFDFMGDMHTAMTDGNVSAGDEAVLRETMEKIDSVLGILKAEEAIDADVEALITERNAARDRKDFAESDRIRDELKAKGILLDDTPTGTIWKRV